MHCVIQIFKLRKLDNWLVFFSLRSFDRAAVWFRVSSSHMPTCFFPNVETKLENDFQQVPPIYKYIIVNGQTQIESDKAAGKFTFHCLKWCTLDYKICIYNVWCVSAAHRQHYKLSESISYTIIVIFYYSFYAMHSRTANNTCTLCQNVARTAISNS